MMYDLIVIGGGPSGATAAKLAAEHGAKVLLLEGEKEGRYKCCAGGIPISNEEFSPIPRGVGEREINGGVLATPETGPMRLEAGLGKDKGYCMFRTDFDKYLLDIAQDAGATVKYQVKAKKIEVSKENGTILGNSEEYKGKCIIIAVGLAGARIQRSLGLEIPPMVNGIQAEFSLPESAIEKHFESKIWECFDKNLIEHGVAWAFPKREAVSIGLLSKTPKITDLQSFFRHPFIKDKIEKAKMMEFGGKKIWACPIPDRMIKKPYCDRVMITGDACGTADPILYEGIYQARLSATLAVDIFKLALEKDDFTESLLKGYNDLLVNHLYEQNLKYSYKMHKIIYHSGLTEDLLKGIVEIAQQDPEMMKSTLALFSGSQTRKEIWKMLMSRKWKLVKKLGVRKSLRLISSLFHVLIQT